MGSRARATQGWYIQYIDRDPRALARKEALEKMKRNELNAEDRRRRHIEKLVAKANAGGQRCVFVFRSLPTPNHTHTHTHTNTPTHAHTHTHNTRSTQQPQYTELKRADGDEKVKVALKSRKKVLSSSILDGASVFAKAETGHATGASGTETADHGHGHRHTAAAAPANKKRKRRWGDSADDSSGTASRRHDGGARAAKPRMSALQQIMLEEKERRRRQQARTAAEEEKVAAAAADAKRARKKARWKDYWLVPGIVVKVCECVGVCVCLCVSVSVSVCVCRGDWILVGGSTP